MEKKPCPVDRGKLMAGLQICGNDNVGCNGCPYERDTACAITKAKDAIAYIYYLEEQLNAKADGSE